MHVASDQGIVVSLDLTVTDELKREGLARDIIRNIQDARKQIGCDITDNIIISMGGDFPKEWTEYICKETLSRIGEVVHPITTVEIQDDDSNVITIAITK